MKQANFKLTFHQFSATIPGSALESSKWCSRFQGNDVPIPRISPSSWHHTSSAGSLSSRQLARTVVMFTQSKFSPKILRPIGYLSQFEFRVWTIESKCCCCFFFSSYSSSSGRVRSCVLFGNCVWRGRWTVTKSEEEFVREFTALLTYQSKREAQFGCQCSKYPLASNYRLGTAFCDRQSSRRCWVHQMIE